HLLKAVSRLFHRLAQSRPFVYFALLAVAVAAYRVVNAYFSKQPGDKEGFAETVGQCVLLHTALRDPLGNELLVTGHFISGFFLSCGPCLLLRFCFRPPGRFPRLSRRLITLRPPLRPAR